MAGKLVIDLISAFLEFFASERRSTRMAMIVAFYLRMAIKAKRYRIVQLVSARFRFGRDVVQFNIYPALSFAKAAMAIAPEKTLNTNLI